MSKRRKFIKNAALTIGGLPLLQYIEDYDNDSKSELQLEIYATNWGFEGSTDEFCKKAKEAGYDGIEVWTPRTTEAKLKLLEAIDRHELKLGLLAGNWGASFREQLDSYQDMVSGAIEMNPEFINSHSGKDFYTKEENAYFLEYSFEQSAVSGIPIYHETHRGRMLFSAPITSYFIDKYDALQLTLDISHWCCVHESLLSDQEVVVKKALSRTAHIHSRVGFAEAPQIPHPDDPQYSEAVKTHFAWWDHVVKMKSEKGEKLTMTAEFGPPPYMWTHPYSGAALADVWEVNLAMKQLWIERYLKK